MTLEHLSEVILKRIISYIVDNVHRVYLIWSCRRFYLARDRLLWFRTDLFSEETQQIRLLTSPSSLSTQLKQLHDELQSKKSSTYIHYGHTPITLAVIPRATQHVVLGYTYNTQLVANALDGSELHSITFGTSFNQPITLDSLPKGLTSLTLGRSFNLPLQCGAFPSTLRHLVFGFTFNQPIGPGCLPEHLQSLSFNYSFNQPLNRETFAGCDSLTHLTLSAMFNQVIAPSSLPASLRTLIFGRDFSKVLAAGALPPRLETLEFGRNFSQDIAPGTLPASLVTLVFGMGFNCKLHATELPNLRRMSTPRMVTTLSARALIRLDLISHFAINIAPQSLPYPALTQLSLHGCQELAPGKIPRTVTKLHLETATYRPLTKAMLPGGLLKLTFGHGFTQAITNDWLPVTTRAVTIKDIPPIPAKNKLTQLRWLADTNIKHVKVKWSGLPPNVSLSIAVINDRFALALCQPTLQGGYINIDRITNGSIFVDVISHLLQIDSYNERPFGINV
ncbi:hypothetical protein SAMD00019534_044420 [Acytostelium subglobosum LB1]|uniref:hypothetical protein n=1 Tax=Acytostelium subglobosum LB1 TaxID=1410327 RepID=UPI000645002E|nr:hypothetical protein SAMD00019534_044420 [Acytostelium subglobosum LB1]GAM21267.1 hypothetical protein SAMD00019534_044420 [Acytostelium subglobosum LB1]|eukprot:XP_012755386.1 hypothetical protein SAMD00019534_044420 [Acytostelium subglobosum LB1]